MPIVIKEAKSIQDLDDVMQVRYESLTEAKKSISSHFGKTKKVLDHFDVYPGTINVVAYGSGEVIGSVRAIEYQPTDELANVIFDYREAARKLRGPMFNIDMVAALRRGTKHDGFMQSILKTTVGLVAMHGGTFTFLSAPDRLLPLASDVGFSAIADRSWSEALQEDVTPMILDVVKFYDQFMASIKDREILRFQETFYRILFAPGEIIITEGDRGSTAFIIETGAVDLVSFNAEKLIHVATLGAGNLVGEVGLVTNEPRTASIIARTHVSCIAFDRETFLKILYQHPNRIIDLFQISSRRLKDATKELSRLQSERGVK